MCGSDHIGTDRKREDRDLLLWSGSVVRPECPPRAWDNRLVIRPPVRVSTPSQVPSTYTPRFGAITTTLIFVELEVFPLGSVHSQRRRIFVPSELLVLLYYPKGC